MRKPAPAPELHSPRQKALGIPDIAVRKDPRAAPSQSLSQLASPLYFSAARIYIVSLAIASSHAL